MMKNRWLGGVSLGAIISGMALMNPLAGTAAPIAAERAQAAAEAMLPHYYPGHWRLQALYPLENLEGARTAYAVVFRRQGAEPKAVQSCEAVLTQALQDTRRTPALRHHDPVLIAADTFATLYIAADDSEPVLLRCQLGLPPPLVAQYVALQETRQARPGQAWRGGRLLFEGMFDELAEILPDAKATNGTASSEPLIVDLRRRQTQELSQSLTPNKAQSAPERDPAIIKACRQAWAAIPAKTSGPIAVKAISSSVPPKNVTTLKADTILEGGIQ